MGEGITIDCTDARARRWLNGFSVHVAVAAWCLTQGDDQ